MLAESAECKITKKGVEYTGTLRVTKSGRTCQRWDSQSPHTHGFTAHFKYPELSVSNAQNFCRNPSNDPNGPWCLTTDPQVYKEYCDVYFCTSCERQSLAEYPVPHISPLTMSFMFFFVLLYSPGGCRTTAQGVDYFGKINYTPSGTICQNWGSDSPHDSNYKENWRWSPGTRYTNANYCRNPRDYDVLPWCYTMNGNQRWEHCTHLPYCQGKFS